MPPEEKLPPKEKANQPKSTREPFRIQGHEVAPGSRALIDLPIGVFTTNNPVSMSIVVVHGKKPGPTLLVTGCIHGDEINGTETIRRLLKSASLKSLKGTLIAVPIVNIPAFLNRSRYLPDRRDLNRLFPGSATGSLGSRIARIVSSELLPLCDSVIDLHTGAVNRPNLPQLRLTLNDPASFELGQVFNPPAILQAQIRPNSFRQICFDLGKPIILFEGGEALRLDTPSIRYGLQGILAIMRHQKMLPARRGQPTKKKIETVTSQKSYWERAPIGGLFTPRLALGKIVSKGSILGFIADPYGGQETKILAAKEGILIGRTNEGLTDEGDGLFHIATFSDIAQAQVQMEAATQALPELPSNRDNHPVPYDPFIDDSTDPEDS